MGGFMEDIAKLTEGYSYQSYKYSFDSVRTPSPEYEDDPDGGESWIGDGETKPHKNPVDLREVAAQLVLHHPTPRLRFFLDGSRHVYHVDDIAYNSRVFPVVAGQVGVACCERVSGHMKAIQPPLRRIVISLPNKCDQVGRREEQFRARLLGQVNSIGRHSSCGLQLDDILLYRTDKLEKGDFRDRGIAKIQDYMINEEKAMVDALAKKGLISDRAYLVKDGSLQYQPMQMDSVHADIRNFKDSYRYVIGVSKSFELVFDRKRR